MPQVIFIGNEEQRLVKRLQEGDKIAAREFYALYADSLAGVCARYIADEEDQKDVFQNALVHIFSHIVDFEYRGTGSLEAWATKVMVNESLKSEIDNALQTLNERERNIIKAFFGIGEPEMTLDEIGTKFGLTRERVRQIKEKALRRLRTNNKHFILKAYLGQ
jgi:DNA-directed RNA polymerase specialized sigma subunit